MVIYQKIFWTLLTENLQDLMHENNNWVSSKKNNRIYISIDEEVEEKLRLIQSQINEKRKEKVCFSQIINESLRKSLEIKRPSFKKCPECSKDGFTVPMAREEKTLVCFLCGFETGTEENLAEFKNQTVNSRNEKNNRESQQTQELLVALTNDLYERFETLDSKKSVKNKKTKLKQKQKEKNLEKKESKGKFFSDLSWYSKKLEEYHNKK